LIFENKILSRVRKEQRRFLFLSRIYVWNTNDTTHTADTASDKIILDAYKETNVFESTSDDRPIGKGFTVRREDNRGRERSTLGIMCLCCARPRQKRGKIRYG